MREREKKRDVERRFRYQSSKAKGTLLSLSLQSTLGTEGRLSSVRGGTGSPSGTTIMVSGNTWNGNMRWDRSPVSVPNEWCSDELNMRSSDSIVDTKNYDRERDRDRARERV